MNRRQFIKISALTGSSATLASCGNPEYHLIRFVPEDKLVPGIAAWKPSICPLCSAGCGINVRVMDGEVEVMRNGQLGLTRMDWPRSWKDCRIIRSATASCVPGDRRRPRLPITRTGWDIR